MTKFIQNPKQKVGQQPVCQFGSNGGFTKNSSELQIVKFCAF